MRFLAAGSLAGIGAKASLPRLPRAKRFPTLLAAQLTRYANLPSISTDLRMPLSSFFGTMPFRCFGSNNFRKVLPRSLSALQTGMTVNVFLRREAFEPSYIRGIGWSILFMMDVMAFRDRAVMKLPYFSMEIQGGVLARSLDAAAKVDSVLPSVGAVEIDSAVE